jgi:hypothetical protein
MYQNRPRRFRRHSNGRNYQQRDNGGTQARLRSNSFSNSQTRNHFRTPQSAEKLFEKYNTLAKEALTSGDKTLSENYFQHADHFARIIENKNINQKQNSVQVDDKLVVSDKHLVENSNVNQDKTVEETKEEKKE